MQQFSTSPREMFASLWRNRNLVISLTKREVIGRYRGSLMGMAWSFFNPILMLAVYTFLFSVVFKARWGTGSDESQTTFAILLFVGMIVHGLFAECVNRAPTLILSNVNYVKKVIFPLEILPWVAFGSALFHSTINLFVLLVFQLVLNHQVTWTAIMFPLVILPLILSTMGFAWLLASLGVYVRDISQIAGVFTTVLMFISPVFYPISALPEKFQTILQLNPLTFIIEEGRNTLIYGYSVNWTQWAVMMLVSTLFGWVGFIWFQKTRKGFSDVI